MATNKITGNTGGVANALVQYTHAKLTVPKQTTPSDASGNHSSSGLPPGTYVVSASAPGMVFNSVAVVIDAANPQDQVVNLRSRAINASNAFTL